MLNLTILIPPKHASPIPVSCVESGRWHRVSKGFTSAPRAQFAEGRAARMRQVTHSLAESRSRDSDQHAVWRLISEKSARLGAFSDTSAMSAMYDKLDDSIEEFVNAFQPATRQVGAVFLINGRAAGLEFFDAGSTYRKLSPKLIRSYALDAIDRQNPAGAPNRHLKETHSLRRSCRARPRFFRPLEKARMCGWAAPSLPARRWWHAVEPYISARSRLSVHSDHHVTTSSEVGPAPV